MNDNKVIRYETSCRQNKPYPKMRFICGQFERINGPQSVPERYISGRWIALRP